MTDENKNANDCMNDEALTTCDGMPYKAEQPGTLNEEEINSAIELFMTNGYWRDYYETAPSPACKRRAALEFYYSKYGHDEGFDEAALSKEEERLESLFGRSDWEHMLEYCRNNPLLSKYQAMIALYNDDDTKKQSALDADIEAIKGRPLLNPYWNPRTNPRIPGSRF